MDSKGATMLGTGAFESVYNLRDMPLTRDHSAADATSHLFFAYLRSLSPEKSTGGISMLPMSLQKLVQETEYPPQRPDLMMSKTNRVVMIVDNVSPTPFALLRRANHFQYRDTDPGLQEFSEFEDPVQALTEECRRVLKSVSAANQSQVSSSKHSTSLKDASWSRFEDVGFSSALEEDDDDESAYAKPPQPRVEGLRTEPASGNGVDRPTTPSWADFLSSGFIDENSVRSNLLLPPPDKVLPPLDTQPRQQSSQSHRPRLESDRDLEPGELASITVFDLDDAFWWVWMSSLAPEETPERKAAFGRCAVVETTIRTDRWLVMEELIAGAAPEPQEGAYIAEKKGFFSWTRRGKTLGRTKSTGKQALNRGDRSASSTTLGKAGVGPDQHAKIQAKAAQLRAAENQSRQESLNSQRRGRQDIDYTKTNSVATLQPNLAGEATAAMKWAKKYDKGAIKEAYLANNSAGRGRALSPAPTEETVGTTEPNASALALPTTPAPAAEPKVEEPPAQRPVTPPPVTTAVPSRKPVTPTPKPAPAPKQAPAPKHSPVLRKQPPQRKVEKEVPKSPPAEVKPEPKSPVEQSPPPPPKNDEPTPEAPEEPPAVAESPAPQAPVAAPAPAPAPAPETTKPKKPAKESKGFRKLFSRKNRASKVPDNAAADVNAFLRDTQQTPEPPVEQTPTPAATPDIPEPIAESSPNDEKANGSNAAEQANGQDSANGNSDFARFNQGPLADQPAFVPQDSDEEDVAPSPTSRQSQYKSGANFKGPPPPPKEEKLSQSTSPGIQDRWAQIRKNAAERAAQREPVRGEETNRLSRAKTGEDDDTSGEESKSNQFPNGKKSEQQTNT